MNESFSTCCKKTQHVWKCCSCICVKLHPNQWICCLPSGLSRNCIQKWNSFFFFFNISIRRLLVNFLILVARNMYWFSAKVSLWSISIHLCQSYFLTRAGFLVPSLTDLSKADPLEACFSSLSRLYPIFLCHIIKPNLWNLVRGAQLFSALVSLWNNLSCGVWSFVFAVFQKVLCSMLLIPH